MRTGSAGSALRRRLTAFVLVAAPLAFAQTLLDFENLPPGTTVNDQYAQQGVRFSDAFLATDPAARSGTRVLRTVNPAAEVFNPIPLKMAFVRPQTRVKLFAMSPGTPRNGTLKAFDLNGAVIAQDGPRMVTADRFTTMFQVSAGQPRIQRAELQLENAAHYAIDDLEFDDSTTNTPPVRVIETAQPAAKDNPAVAGKFPPDFRLGQPPASAGSKAPEPGGEPPDRIDIAGPAPVERQLAPGATARLATHVNGRAGLAASVRWTGTAAPLNVTLSFNGSVVASGNKKTFALGANRGGADIGAAVKAAGDARLSVTNTSKVPVRVRLTLGIVGGQGQ